MSGDWSDSDFQRAQTLGYRVFIKPFKMDEMDNWLDECETRIDPTRQLDFLYQDEWIRQQSEEQH